MPAPQNANSPSTREGEGATILSRLTAWLRNALGLERGKSLARPGETLVYIERPHGERPRILQ